MNKLVLLLVALFAVGSLAQYSAAPEMKFLWNTWKQIHGKVYSEVEEMKRFAVFVENYFGIVTHNAKKTGVKLALNHLADLTKAEFKSQYASGLKMTSQKKEEMRLRKAIKNNGFLKVDYSVLALPESVDWREKGAVTPVKNQAKCGSCWTFSTTGALEGFHFIKTGKLLDLSEQQLVDCVVADDGCNGGLQEDALDYTSKHGIQVEADYPYKAVDQKCAYDAKKAIKINAGYEVVEANNVDALKAAIVAQPIAVSVQADEDVFHFYSSGVVKSDCGAELDHAVLAVGYGVIEGTEAFIVKNSWTEKWGQNGYIYLSTDPNQNDGAGVCGILGDSSYPTA